MSKGNIMFETKITEMLGIEYPIILGGMMWLGRAGLAAAVSEAGGFGIITALSTPRLSELKDEMRRVKDLTDKPFGVNVSMLPVLTPGDMTDKIIDVICDEGCAAIETAGRSPQPYVKKIHSAGIKLIHKVPAIRYAQKAESVGVDAVTIVGFECGGHPGMDDVTSLILIPLAADKLKIPVIAAGGFGDGRGLVTALALGADAVLMGTRFVATKECIAHPGFKQWLLRMRETDTMIIERSIRNACRVARNKAAEEVLEMENKGATLEELLTVMGGTLGRKAYIDGELDAGVVSIGQIVGMIDDIPTVKELFERIISQAKETIHRLDIILGDN